MDAQMLAQDYIEELITALDKAITEKQKKKTQICKLGILLQHEQLGVTYCYKFSLPNIKIAISDEPCYLQYGSQETECTIITSDSSSIQISVTDPLPETCKSYTLVKDDIQLLIALKEKYETVRTEKLFASFQRSADIFNRDLTTWAKVIPNLQEYKNLNKYQQNAIISSLYSDTLVWGPPGTGKTKIIANAINEHLKLGHRILLLSHANTAVDGALGELAPLLLNNTLYQNGQILRLGSSTGAEIQEFDLLLMDNILAQKTSKLQIDIDKAYAALKPLQDRQTILNEAKKKKSSIDLAKEMIDAAEQERVRCEKEIKHSQAEIADTIENLAILSKIIDKKNSSPLNRMWGKSIADLEKQLEDLLFQQPALQRELSKHQTNLNDILSEIKQTQSQCSELQQTYSNCLQLLGFTTSNPSLQKEFDKAEKEIVKLNTVIDQLHKQKAEMRSKVIADARVIGTTLTQTYLSRDLTSQQFDCVFIDEISMAPLWTVFWAISLIKKNCVFIGDFLQLPPVSGFHDELVKHWTERSLFDVLNVNTVPVAQNHKYVKALCIQYRMNPAISALANEFFYGEMLQNGGNTIDLKLSDDLFGSQPLTLVDTSEVNPYISVPSKSKYNFYNAVLSCKLAISYLQKYPKINLGIIAPYAAQVALIRKLFTAQCEQLNIDGSNVIINTVHSFQGGENDIIIFDCVEGPGSKTGYFLDDGNASHNNSAKKLINVAITRAKRKLIFIANVKFINTDFSKNATLKKLLATVNDPSNKSITRVDSKELDGAFLNGSTDIDTHYIKTLLSAQDGHWKHHDQNSFWYQFIEDLKQAQRQVVIFSPFIAQKRITALSEAFEASIRRDVSIIAVTRPINDHMPAYQPTVARLLHSLQQMHISVKIRNQMHEKIILIDDNILWEGSLNLLSFRDTSEQMIRIVGSSPISEIKKLLDLPSILALKEFDERQVQKGNTSHTNTPPSNPSKEIFSMSSARNSAIQHAIDPNAPPPLCKKCHKKMVIRTNRETGKPFYGCPDFPRCRS